MGNATSSSPPVSETSVPTTAIASSTRSAISASLRDSTRSWKSHTSSENERSTSVHSNLMRAKTGRDPMTVYEVMKVLGEGSMGSVSMVKKRDNMIGGSARKDVDHKCCGNFSFCLPFVKSKSDSLHGKFQHLESIGSSDHSKRSFKNPKILEKASSHLVSFHHKKDLYYALKSIHLDRCTSTEYKRELVNEVNVLKQLDHPNIVKALETYDYKSRLFLVLELCSGGDLYSRDPYTEDQASMIVASLLNAVAFLHDHDIVHRDLKFENIMFCSPQSDEIKLIDFGLSQKFAKGDHLKDAVGTVYTMSPELLKGDYDAKADVWSVGVITFMLLSSSMPFYGKDRLAIIKKIVAGKFKFAGRRWRAIDADAKIFIRDLLEYDPEERPTAERAMRLSWLCREDLDRRNSLSSIPDVMDNIQANIQAFSEYSKLKKLALMVMAYQSSSEDVALLRRVFTKFDRRKHGVITLPEFKEALSENYNYTDEEMEQMYHGIDIDGTGTVHYVEFIAATLESLGQIEEEALAEAFDRIDADDTGYITVSSLRDFLGADMPLDYLKEIIAEVDIIKDKKISYEEFLALWDTESDEKFEKVKSEVKSKRKIRNSIRKMSLRNDDITSSFSEDTVDSSLDASCTSSATGHDGNFFFAQRREMSVRGQWV